MHDTKSHPNKILITAEMKEANIIDQKVSLKGCRGFLETALFNILFAIYERDSDLFLKVMEKFMEALSKE